VAAGASTLPSQSASGTAVTSTTQTANATAVTLTIRQTPRISGSITCVLSVYPPTESTNAHKTKHYQDDDAYLRCTVTGSMRLEDPEKIYNQAIDWLDPQYGTWGRITKYHGCQFLPVNNKRWHCGATYACTPSIAYTFRQEAVASAKWEIAGRTGTLRIPRKGTGYSRDATLHCL
jgi:hypothetical protein